MHKLLIVEDEIIIAEGIKLYVEEHNYEAYIATNSTQAIKYLNSTEFSAVVCDINLEENINGIELIQQYHYDLNHGPVIFLTAYSNTEVMELAESILPYAYIIKPFYNKQLLTTINLAISHFKKSQVSAEAPVQSALIEQLSSREKEVLTQLATGKTNKDIGDFLCISKHTVDTHVRNIKEKLNIHKKGGLIKFVLTHSLE